MVTKENNDLTSPLWHYITDLTSLLWHHGTASLIWLPHCGTVSLIWLPHHDTMSPQHHITASQCHSFDSPTMSPQHHVTASLILLPHHITMALCHHTHLTSPWQHCITHLTSHLITTSLCHSFDFPTASPHHCSTVAPHGHVTHLTLPPWHHITVSLIWLPHYSTTAL